VLRLLAIVAVLSPSVCALAEDGPLQLAAPTLGSSTEAHQIRVSLRSEADHDTARISRAHGEDAGEDLRCDTPCSFRLPPGEYRVYYSAARKDAMFHVATHDLVVEGRPDNLFELVGGIVSGVVGLVLLGIALFVGEGVCFDVGSTGCPIERGPVMLGAASFLVALGVALALDSPGGVEVTAI
jgi:hypothetical protein